MEKCIYCSKLYTERGINLHKSKCKLKFKSSIIEINSDLKFNESLQKKNIFNRLPDEILLEINNFLLIKDNFCSYRRFYKKYIIVLPQVCKRFFNLFYLSHNEIINFKKNILEEKEKNICKSTAKNDYLLKDKELDELIPYKSVKNPHYSSSSPMKIYNIANILDYLGNIYGSESLYYDKIILNEKKKLENKEKTVLTKQKRKENYDILMNKYNFYESEKIYIEYKDYITKGSPGIKKVEEYIINYIQQEERKNILFQKLEQENILFKDNEIVNNYINENKYSMEEAYLILKNIQMRENLIKDDFLRNDLNFNYENKNFFENKMIKNYIDEDNITINEIIKYIKDKQERKNILISRLKEHNLQLRSDSELCSNYIEENDNDLDYVVNTMIEMDFYFKYTNYRNEFKNVKYELGGYYEDGVYEYDYISISNIAKERSFRTWCNKYKNYEDCIINIKNTNLYLPSILYEKIQLEFEKIKKEKKEKQHRKLMKEIRQKYKEKYQEKRPEINKNKHIQKKNHDCIMCICYNIPSPLCGYCKNCCILESCKKHSNKNKN